MKTNEESETLLNLSERRERRGMLNLVVDLWGSTTPPSS